MPAGWVSAGVATVGLINNMTSGNTGPSSQGQSDPYGPYRGQAANQLNSLVNNPSQALSAPGFQQTLQQGQQTVNRGMAATGQLQSGAEQSALQSLGQNTFSSYYNAQLANLMQLSGASQNPAAAGLAQSQAATLAQNRTWQNANQASSAIGGLFNTGGNSNLGGGAANYYGSSAISGAGSLLGDTGAGTTSNSFGQAVNNEFAQGI